MKNAHQITARLPGCQAIFNELLKFSTPTINLIVNGIEYLEFCQHFLLSSVQPRGRFETSVKLTFSAIPNGSFGLTQ